MKLGVCVVPRYRPFWQFVFVLLHFLDHENNMRFCLLHLCYSYFTLFLYIFRYRTYLSHLMGDVAVFNLLPLKKRLCFFHIPHIPTLVLKTDSWFCQIVSLAKQFMFLLFLVSRSIFILLYLSFAMFLNAFLRLANSSSYFLFEHHL